MKLSSWGITVEGRNDEMDLIKWQCTQEESCGIEGNHICGCCCNNRPKQRSEVRKAGNNVSEQERCGDNDYGEIQQQSWEGLRVKRIWDSLATVWQYSSQDLSSPCAMLVSLLLTEFWRILSLSSMWKLSLSRVLSLRLSQLLSVYLCLCHLSSFYAYYAFICVSGFSCKALHLIVP